MSIREICVLIFCIGCLGNKIVESIVGFVKVNYVKIIVICIDNSYIKM